MPAKTDLFDRLEYLNAALLLPELVDIGIATSTHNGVANLLRKGLGIMAFNIIEDYIKVRSVEALATLSNSTLPFSKLTDTLQSSAIFGALEALLFRSRILKKNGVDVFSFIQDETLKIHSTKNLPYTLSELSLVSSASNVSSDEVGDLIKAFGIVGQAGGWNAIKSVSNQIGGGIPDLVQSYRNASSRRHSSAHTASFYYNFQWLLDIKAEILALSAAIDILITARCRQVSSNLAVDMGSHNINQQLNYRFLEPRGNHYAETKTIGGKSMKNWVNVATAVGVLQPLLENRKEFLIVLNGSKRIEDWYS